MMNKLAYLLNKIVELKMSPTDECVEWPFSLNRQGYGQVWFQNRVKRVHRVAFQLYHNKQAEELVLHKCDNPKCYNPNHLYVGDHKQNAKDAKERGRRRVVKKIAKSNNGRKPRSDIGSLGSNAKLTEEDVTKILKMLNEGKTVRAIAEKFPVTYQAIGLIKIGRTWKHLPRPWQT